MFVLSLDAQIDQLERQNNHLQKNKKLLKIWIHKIGCKNLLLTSSSWVCSIRFKNSARQLLRPEEYPTTNLPILTTPVHKSKSSAKRAHVYVVAEVFTDEVVLGANHDDTDQTKDAAVQTVETLSAYSQLQVELTELRLKLSSSHFRLSNIADKSQKV